MHICNSASTFTWQSIYGAKTAYPHVPIFIVANPDSGPGSGTPPNCASNEGFPINRTRDYDNGIGNLTRAGIVVLGYVDAPTSSSETDVENNITTWQQCYPGIQGIFLDDMPSYETDSYQSHYKDITNWIHNTAHLAYSFGNPGNDLLQNYQGTTDLLDIYENDHNDTLNFAAPFTNYTLQGNNVPLNYHNWHTLNDKNTYSFLQFNKTSIAKQGIQNETVYVGFMYFTDNTGCGTNPVHPAVYCSNHHIPFNPWNTTASYLVPMASYLNNISVLPTIQSLNKAGNSIHISNMTIYQSNNLVRNGTTPFTYNETSIWQFNYTAPRTNFTGSYHFCYWTYPGVNTTSKSILVTPSTSVTYSATYDPSCP